MGRLSARWRFLLTPGFPDHLAAMTAGIEALQDRLQKIENDIAALRTILRTREERAEKKLKAGLTSLVNVISILPELGIKGTIPPFPHQGFEITGEEAAFLFHLVRRHRPKVIMELGSGSSTVLLAAVARANGAGRVISIEHDPAHARHTAELLEQAELSDRVELVLAPLVDMHLGERAFQWYDLRPLLDTFGEKIDLLFVDGPPGKVQSLSRYPALPVLMPHLAPCALIFIDDGAREDETKMVAMWGEMDQVAFDIEALDFLPHAPVLLTLAGGERRVAELRRAREERSDAPAEEVGLFGQGRRSGVS